MESNRNFYIAIILSFLLIAGWQYLYVRPHYEAQRAAEANGQLTEQNIKTGQIPQAAAPKTTISREEALTYTQRIPVETQTMQGSINLQGASFDDIALTKYHVTTQKNSPNITLLNPNGTDNTYIAEFGFASAQLAANLLPQTNTKWQIISDNKTLTPKTPITLAFDNQNGLRFQREISVDDNYMFFIKDSVINNGTVPISLSSYGRVARAQIPEHQQKSYLLHEGLIGIIGDQGLQTEKYVDMEKLTSDNPIEKQIAFASTNQGWIGITDKYWAAVIIPEQNTPYTSRFSYFKNSNQHFQSDLLTKPFLLQPGEQKTVINRLFVGPKVVDIINNYENNQHIEKFGLLIDWGLFSFITKPMFFLIDFFYKLAGNFGVAILLATVFLKVLLFPLANKSYKSMSKMRLLQSSIEKIKERYPDRMDQQRAIMQLYQEKKINPFAGCLPVLIQMPIFFALYKVLYITIEMRHAPFFGWIHDLAAPDPTSIFNLFGLLHFSVPQFLMVGAWPIIMGITMFLQMRMNPLPTDPVQATIFTYLPIIFCYMLASFPVGLVIYWAWNNSLSIIQQAIIMKKEGVDINLFNNIKDVFRRKSKITRK